jgi:hypothetical protein
MITYLTTSQSFMALHVAPTFILDRLSRLVQSMCAAGAAVLAGDILQPLQVLGLRWLRQVHQIVRTELMLGRSVEKSPRL